MSALSSETRSPRQTKAHVRASKTEAPAQSGLRALTEWLVLLALAVTLFRCFGVESYMISTGSMAPCLLGFHLRLTCPSCGLTFAHGASGPNELAAGSPREGTLSAQAIGKTGNSPEKVPCPNCSRLCSVGTSAVAIEGDQLLVHKGAYAWRELAGKGGPRRWEIVVFRKPDDEHPAYVKRVVGLPSENVELRDGDVYANGQLQRKPLTAQLSTRVLVASSEFPAVDDDPDWETRWSFNTAQSAWRVSGSTFEHVPHTGGAVAAPEAAASPSPWDWITYRHWVRSGGATSTSVSLDHWPDDLQPPDPLLSPLEYDSTRQRLRCLGALPHVQWKRWDAATADAEFRSALWDLYRESHVVPLTDASPYNRTGVSAPNPVHDLLLELTVEWRGGDGGFAVEMTDGAREFRTELDFGRREVQVLVDGDDVLFTGPLSVTRGTPIELLMSTFDQQLLLAQDGELVCDPIPYERTGDPPAPLRRPVRFGARDAAVAVTSASLYRDVYYTPAPEHSAQVFNLKADEYFVLGDNSGVSIDGRHWEQPGVPESDLIGKALFVHLPSRPLRLEWGGEVRQIRVPDFKRMRYIQ